MILHNLLLKLSYVIPEPNWKSHVLKWKLGCNNNMPIEGRECLKSAVWPCLVLRAPNFQTCKRGRRLEGGHAAESVMLNFTEQT